ncbi:25S rRNA (uridine(2843)-N(3))-methyltransferase [Cytospora mali]|uniref:25S rRNA (Uridine(2843)-N(3))-methyltransferase n=1 Tax=Cytospora mali TaxID=578113 RepID=A0A194W568_CYTMA|nr:25S rRNA (uridine(2843)-N(3))-methyltransferase [Valsa mali]
MGQFDRKAKSQPKHGKPLSSGASKAAPRPTRGPPGWKGPCYIRKKKTPQQPAADSEAAGPLSLEHALPVELEQLILDIFRTTFPASNDFEALKPTLQEVKDALFRRDFDAAFGRDHFLEAYAIRWSPSRALAYAQLLTWACRERADDACFGRLRGGGADGQEGKPARVVCLGGGAAEIMAFSAVLRHLRPSRAAGRPGVSLGGVSEGLKDLSASEAAHSPQVLLDLHLVDTADWSSVLSKLYTGLTTPPALSKYASAAARAANASFVLPGAVKHTFTRTDILGCSTESLSATIGHDPALLTLLFTLNELYTASMPRTTAFLLRLTEATPKGSMLLVVDSPGSYSEAAVGDAKEGEGRKKYPLSWLVDYVLVPKPKKTDEDSDYDDDDEAGEKPRWEKIVGEDSMWYRLEEGLDYPVSLENMRFQVHLFRRI